MKGLFPGVVAVCRVGFACLQADLSLQLKLVPEKTTVLGEGSLGWTQDLAALVCWSQSWYNSCFTSFYHSLFKERWKRQLSLQLCAVHWPPLQVEKTEATRYCSRSQTEVAEPGLDFGAVSQANGSLNLPAFRKMGLGGKGDFHLGIWFGMMEMILQNVFQGLDQKVIASISYQMSAGSHV